MRSVQSSQMGAPVVPVGGSSAVRFSTARFAARHSRLERRVLAFCAGCVAIVCGLAVATIVKELAHDRPALMLPLQP